MKRSLSLLLALLILSTFTFSQGLSLSNKLSKRQQLAAFMQYGNQEESPDTVAYNFEKSPALSFLMSAAVPGAGQFYVGEKWWAAGFLGVEALGWGLWYNRKTYGEDMEDEYKQFADNKWNFGAWLEKWANNPGAFGESHEINVVRLNQQGDIIDGSLMEVSDTFYVDYAEDPDRYMVVKDRDYYENIGKYDQFVAGWQDFNQADTTSDLRLDYMDKRDESNRALKMATKSLTVVMFNHLFSALHAQFAAKHYSSAEKPKEMSWNLSLTPSRRKGQLISGLNLSFKL